MRARHLCSNSPRTVVRRPNQGDRTPAPGCAFCPSPVGRREGLRCHTLRRQDRHEQAISGQSRPRTLLNSSPGIFGIGHLAQPLVRLIYTKAARALRGCPLSPELAAPRAVAPTHSTHSARALKVAPPTLVSSQGERQSAQSVCETRGDACCRASRAAPPNSPAARGLVPHHRRAGSAAKSIPPALPPCRQEREGSTLCP